MAPEHIEVDGDLLGQAMHAQGLASKSATVDSALRLLARDPPTRLAPPRPLTREEALEMRGSGWEVNPGGADSEQRDP